MNRRVVAIVATMGRPAVLRRLLECLQAAGVDEVVVVDNGASAETEAAMSASTVPSRYVASKVNLGCGGGLRLAGETALQWAGPAITHLLIVDDDAVLPPGAIDGLIGAMSAENAALAHALVTDDNGKVSWPAGVDRALGRRMSASLTPDELYVEIGAKPLPFVWAQGICLIVQKKAIDAVGLHRHDFWVRGEDAEFTLRLTRRYRGVVVPTVVAQHLPPPATSISHEVEYLKHCALLQNVVYVGLRLRHGWCIAWTIVPIAIRLLRMWSWRSFGDVMRAIWRGAIRGEPAGAGTGDTFMAKAAELQRR